MYPKKIFERFIKEQCPSLKPLLYDTDVSKKFDMLMDIKGKSKNGNKYYSLISKIKRPIKGMPKFNKFYLFAALKLIHRNILPFFIDEYKELFIKFCEVHNYTDTLLKNFNESNQYRRGDGAYVKGPIKSIDEYIDRIDWLAPMDWLNESFPDVLINIPEKDLRYLKELDEAWFATLRQHEETKELNSKSDCQ